MIQEQYSALVTRLEVGIVKVVSRPWRAVMGFGFVPCLLSSLSVLTVLSLAAVLEFDCRALE